MACRAGHQVEERRKGPAGRRSLTGSTRPGPPDDEPIGSRCHYARRDTMSQAEESMELPALPEPTPLLGVPTSSALAPLPLPTRAHTEQAAPAVYSPTFQRNIKQNIHQHFDRNVRPRTEPQPRDRDLAPENLLKRLESWQGRKISSGKRLTGAALHDLKRNPGMSRESYGLVGQRRLSLVLIYKCAIMHLAAVSYKPKQMRFRSREGRSRSRSRSHSLGRAMREHDEERARRTSTMQSA